MADIELMTSRHFDDVIQEIRNNSCFDWTKVNAKNIRIKRLVTTDTFQVSGPALLLGTSRKGRLNIIADGWKFDNYLIGDMVPFIFALNGFEAECYHEVAYLYYILI